MNLPELFPAGEWNHDKTAFVVRDGQYWCPVATQVDGEMALTPLGVSLSGPPPEKLAYTSTSEVESPKRGKVKKTAAVSVDDLDL